VAVVSKGVIRLYYNPHKATGIIVRVT